MRSVVIGAAGSTCIILETLIRLNNPPELVLTLDEDDAKDMSAFRPVNQIAMRNKIRCEEFKNINDRDTVELIREMNPDYIFAVGFSQLVKKEILNIPKYGVVGFHPTALPKYRGRAAIVWQMLLGVRDAKVSLFLMDEGADSGDILGQEPYEICEDDYAEDVLRKSDDALRELAPKVIQKMLDGTLEPVKQDEKQASYLLARRPDDGLIDWELSGKEIVQLIRATSRPYPGAFSYYDGKNKVVFWKADFIENNQFIGFHGQIAFMEDGHLAIVVRDGLIDVSEFEIGEDIKIRVGHRFKA